MPFSKKKVDPNLEVEAGLAEAIRAQLLEGTLTCAAAFAVAGERNVPRLRVGQAADVLRIPLSRCQLGLFGYPGPEKIWETPDYREPDVPPALEEAILATRDKKNTISCEALMAVAERFGLLKAVAGRAADRLGVKVRPCQLGAF